MKGPFPVTRTFAIGERKPVSVTLHHDGCIEMRQAGKAQPVVTSVDRVDADDRANARGREVALHDWTTRALALAVISLFAVQMFLLTRQAIPAENRDAANQLLGILFVAVTVVLSYYFGSSAGSRTKDAVLGRVAEGRK